MKKLILSIALVTFAVAVQASDAKPCKDTTAVKSPCCSETTKTSVKAESTCPFASGGCCTKDKQTAMKKVSVKHALLSPKAAAL